LVFSRKSNNQDKVYVKINWKLPIECNYFS
jgi:hypothetical protein